MVITGREPNVQPHIGDSPIFQGRTGGPGFAYGGRGYYGGFPSRYAAAPRLPGMPLPPIPGTENLNQTQRPFDLEKLLGVRSRVQPGDRLREISTAAGWAGAPSTPGVGGPYQGAGFGQPGDSLRRLLMARLGQGAGF